ncbi:uncharacterized protein O3C94_008720 [Discoglossus pictus]
MGSLLCLVVGIIVVLMVESVATTAEKCDKRQETPTRKYTKFVTGTKILYTCNDGYSRSPGPGGLYTCDSSSGDFTWKDKSKKEFECKSKNAVTKSTNQSGIVSSVTITEQLQRSLGDPSRDNETEPRDYCVTQVIPNAYFNVRTFPLGLEYQDCQNQTGPCWVFRCMSCNNKTTWVNLTEGCITRMLPNETKPVIACSTIVVIALIIILGIIGKKQWEKKSTRNIRSEEKTSNQTSETNKDLDAVQEPLYGKQ